MIARADYIDKDPRYGDLAFNKQSDRKKFNLWCEKEYRNLVRAWRAGQKSEGIFSTVNYHHPVSMGTGCIHSFIHPMPWGVLVSFPVSRHPLPRASGT